MLPKTQNMFKSSPYIGQADIFRNTTSGDLSHMEVAKATYNHYFSVGDYDKSQ
jgi:hypothetical protein